MMRRFALRFALALLALTAPLVIEVWSAALDARIARPFGLP